MLENGQWDEELRSRLWRAKQWKEKLGLEIKLQQLALEKWTTYIETLERAQELETELDLSTGVLANSNGKAKTVTDSLIAFAFQKPDYIFAVKDSIAWLVEQNLYSDEKGAADSVYGILSHRTDLFERRERATYHLTAKAIGFGKNLMQPRLPVTSSIPSVEPRRKLNQDKHTPLSKFILKALKNGEKSLQELKQEAEQNGISYTTKKLGRVMHYALVGMAQNRLVEKINGIWRLKGDIYMECPACREYRANNPMDVARHMIGVFDEPHIKSIEAYGLNAAEVVKTGNYKPLVEALERTAKLKS